MLTSQLMGSPANVQDGIALANAIVDTVRDPLVVLDQNLRVITASRSFYNTFRLTRDDVHGLLLYEIDLSMGHPRASRVIRRDLKRQSHCGGL